MRKKSSGDESRVSALAQGWTIETGAESPPTEAVGAFPAESEAMANDPKPEDASPEEVASDDATEPRSSIELVLLGVTGGLFLLYAWVWYSWANYYAQLNATVAAGSGVLGGVLQQIVFWAAPFAPLFWFITVLVLTRGAGRRALGIALGAIVLVPLPALIVGGGA